MLHPMWEIKLPEWDTYFIPIKVLTTKLLHWDMSVTPGKRCQFFFLRNEKKKSHGAKANSMYKMFYLFIRESWILLNFPILHTHVALRSFINEEEQEEEEEYK